MTAAPRNPTGDELHQAVAARLQRVGQRYTAARRQLVDAMASAGGPQPVHDIVARGPGLPLSSAYRNLADLAQAGVVVRVTATDDVARYELAEDLAGHHHHLLCTGCGVVVDFTLSGSVERALLAAAAQAANSTGFQATGHRVDLLGVCERCS